MMRRLAILGLCFAAGTATAQTGVALGGFDYDKGAPVEITADALDVNQSTGNATFDGNVVIGQGGMRLAAGKVVVEYGADASGKNEIRRLVASGGVTLVSAEEAAEAQTAIYSVADGTIVLSGAVLVTQGPAAISGDQLSVDLSTGSGTVTGNVRTVLNPGGN